MKPENLKETTGYFYEADTGKLLNVPCRWLIGRGTTPISQWPLLGVFTKALQEGRIDPDFYKKALNKPGDRKINPKELERLLQDREEPAIGYLLEDGMILVWDGHHRISRKVAGGATSLKVYTIPSPAWRAFEKQVTGLYDYGPKKLYQAIEHPWFTDWITHRGATRYSAIVKAIQDSGVTFGSHLDIACSTGGIARSMSKAGFGSYGVDTSEGAIIVAQYLNRVFHSKVVYSCAPFERWLDDALIWDVVTCLSFTNHYFERGENEKGVLNIRNMVKKSRRLIMDMPDESIKPLRDLGPVPRQRAAQERWLAETAETEVTYFGTFEGRNSYVLKGTRK